MGHEDEPAKSARIKGIKVTVGDDVEIVMKDAKHDGKTVKGSKFRGTVMDMASHETTVAL